MPLRVDVLADAEAVAREGARRIAAAAREAAAERGRCCLALSGGSTPWAMLAALVRERLPWHALHVFQVDERVAPSGDPDRNLTRLAELLAPSPLPADRLHAMPVEEADLELAAARYAQRIEDRAGAPASLDLVHLGLGPDGHTASLVPGDAVLDVRDRDVALTERPYQGRRRMTMTFPLLERAQRILWLVTGSEKRDALARLRRGDPSLPAARVPVDRAFVLADRAAAGT